MIRCELWMWISASPINHMLTFVFCVVVLMTVSPFPLMLSIFDLPTVNCVVASSHFNSTMSARCRGGNCLSKINQKQDKSIKQSGGNYSFALLLFSMRSTHRYSRIRENYMNAKVVFARRYIWPSLDNVRWEMKKSYQADHFLQLDKTRVVDKRD